MGTEPKTVRITAFIAEQYAEKFTALTRRIGVSGTALLSNTLSSELDYLAEIPPSTQRFEDLSNFLASLEFDSGGNLVEVNDKPKVRRLNITLDREVADRMNEICREKRIQRDQFINAYVGFLVDDKGPLQTVAEILVNPRSVNRPVPQ